MVIASGRYITRVVALRNRCKNATRDRRALSGIRRIEPGGDVKGYQAESETLEAVIGQDRR